MLYNLTKDNLIKVSDFLGISGVQRANIKGKFRMSLITHIIKHLEREEAAELEDAGMSELLELKDRITELTAITENVAIDSDQERQKVQKELEELQKAVKQKEAEVQQLATAATQNNQPQSPAASNSTPQITAQPQSLSPPWRKEFKISGQIGELGQKDKLNFSSLVL